MAEALVSLAYVRQADLVEQNLLEHERGDGSAELRAGLHNAQQRRNDFRGQQVVHHGLVVGLGQRAEHAQAAQAQVLELFCFRRGLQERVEQQRHIGVEERASSLFIAGDGCQNAQSIAYSVGLVVGQRRGVYERVHVGYFLDDR